jgi:hypothetical protein
MQTYEGTESLCIGIQLSYLDYIPEPIRTMSNFKLFT